MISLVWAMDENRLIGFNNRLPWHLIEDLKHFNQITMHKKVLMGETTYLSMKSYYKNKALPYDKIYVASLEGNTYEGTFLVNDLAKFLNSTQEDIFVLGGKIMYEFAFKYAHSLYITYVLGKYEGNVYLKNFDMTKFRLVDKTIMPGLIFTHYVRK